MARISARRALDERAVGVIAVSRDDDRAIADEPEQRLGGRRPVHREPVAEPRRRAVLDEVTRAQDIGVGDRDHDVIVGVAAPEIREMDLAPVQVQHRALGERAIGRVEHDLGEVGRDGRELLGRRRALRVSGRADHRHAPLVPPDHGRPEGRVAEAVVAVAVSVDDDADAGRTQLAEVVEDLPRLDERGSGVDDEGCSAAQHGHDVLVVEAVAAHEDAVADLGPQGGHRGIVATPV